MQNNDQIGDDAKMQNAFQSLRGYKFLKRQSKTAILRSA